METVALLYEDYQKELAEDFKNTFLKRASDTDSSRSNDTVIDEVTDMLSTNIAVYTEKLLQRWGFSSGGEGGGGGDVTVTLDDLLKKYLSDNYVTIKGDQEVFGEKDFRKGIRIAGRRLYWDEGNDALVIEGAAYTTRWLSAKGVSPGGGGAGSGGAAAMYQLIDVSPNDTKDAVLGAEKDYVLTFDGSFWRGMPNKGGLSSKLFTALDKEGNEVNPDDENAEIYAIRANYSLWSVGFLSAKGISDGGTGGGGGGAVALYQLLDVEKNADITGVAGATKGSVLTFNGDKWYADKPKTAAGISNLFTALDNDGNEVDLNDESKLGTITNIRANYALWSVDWISAKGKSSGGSGGGGGLINLVYGFESLGGTFDNNDNSATFNAFTINEIWKLASSGLTNVTVTGSGNAVTDVIKGSDGRSLTFTKGNTFATKSEFDALNTKFNDFLTGSDADDIINKWSELEVFLQGMKESDNLAVILQSKMDKTAFSKLFTALDASGNEVDPSDSTKTIASIRANFGFWGVDYISAKGVSMPGVQTGTLADLNDVEITDPTNGQALKYDAASKKWVNGTIDSFNVNQMWAELKKADSSKIIDASHIPTSVLDGRWVKKTGDTMTGTLTSASTNNAIIFKGLENCDITNFYTMNGTLDSNSRLAIRNGLRFNWYDTYWYIGNIRGESTDSNGFGIANEFHKLCLQVTPNNTIAPVFRSTVATGVSPLIVSSNTTVDNLSADLLDGYHAFGTSNALIKYGYTVGGTKPAWCRIATYSIRNTEIMTDVCFVLHSAFSDLFGLLVVKTRGTAVVEGLLIVSYNINRSNIRIYHDAEKKNIELYCYGGSNYSIIQANLLYSHDRNGGANTNITLYRADTKAPSWSTYVNPGFVNLQNSSEMAKKLETPRTLWGQSFDGSANVSGDMTGVGNITMGGDLKIGNGTSPNTIYFYGTTGDSPGGYNHTFIAERFWGGKESSELVLFKGNDIGNGNEAVNVSNSGPDRIRHIAAAHLFQTYTEALAGSVESVCTSSSLKSLFGIAANRVTSYVPFMSTVGTGTQPYQCNSTTLNTNLNADMLDNWHLNFLPRNYNNARTYSVQFALGDTDNNWRKIFACSESGTGPWRSVTVWGQIWYAYGNHAQDEVRYYHFCVIFQMRGGETSSGSNVGSVVNSARLYLPTFAKGMDNIRLVRVGTNNFELQVRQIGSYNNGYIQYQYWANGANVSAWEKLQSTSNTSVAVSAGGASTLADSRASSAYVLTTSRTLWGRPFNGSANIDGNIDNAAVITSKSGICLDLKGSSGVAFYAGGSLCAVMNTTGVGIGTSSPSQKLHVAGNIIATGAITAKASSSDIRLKTDIQGYDAMGIIRKFRSVKYHWNAIAKENSEVFNHDNWNYGLIAQDLLSGGYSQWVSDIFKDYYTIDYERLIPVVWKGLQEVDDEVTKLKREVARLNKRVKELEKSLCA